MEDLARGGKRKRCIAFKNDNVSIAILVRLAEQQHTQDALQIWCIVLPAHTVRKGRRGRDVAMLTLDPRYVLLEA